MAGRVALVTGGSRGIGRAVALRLAEEGASVATGAKTVTSSPKLPGTIHDTAREVEARGGRALAVRTDVRDEAQIAQLVEETIRHFGRLDVVVNNAGAIAWQPLADLPIRLFDRMTALNFRAPALVCREAIPHLRQAGSGHIVNLCPPLGLGALAAETWEGRTAYLMTKFGMSHLTLGLAEELLADGIAVNGLWPESLIDTQATRVFARWFEGHGRPYRTPALVADACVELVCQAPGRTTTGRLLIVEEFLTSLGWDSFDRYDVAPPPA
jgi:citronellol/citronellal dehydrogenase